MSVPKPPASLDNSCSVIHDNTLYIYSADVFLSIPLENGAAWNTLEMGVKVTGARCVGSTAPDTTEPGFFVVGGKADLDDYSGLQKYTYSTRTWATINLSDPVIKNRQWHASIYIPADNVILVYAGSQDESRGPSGQTFTIQASPPYTLRGYQSAAPPASSPYLMSWSNADVVMVVDTAVWLFNPSALWRVFGATLASPLKQDATSMQAVLMDMNSTKEVYTFDFSQSPNKVGRIALENAAGAPVQDSATVTSWPEYNATFAPTVTRQNAAVAQGSDGLVVFSGGNNDNPIIIFNATDSSWVNTSALLGDKKEQKFLLASSTTSSLITSSTSSSIQTKTTGTAGETSTTAAAAIPPAAVDQNKDSSSPGSDTILGITLGSIAGLMALLGLILLLLRRRKKRQNQNHAEAGQARHAGGASSDEKDAVDFANSTLRTKSAGQSRGHYPQASQESYSSMAILMGRMGKDKSGLSRKASNGTAQSSVSSLHKQFKSTISKPIPQSANHPPLAGQDDRGVAFVPTVVAPRPRNRNGPIQAQDGTRRSSGWNRYWSGGSALQILGFGGAAKRNTAVSEQSSRYSEVTTNDNARVTQDSATVPPLNFEYRPEVNSVVSGSPVVSQFASNVRTEGMSGKIERPVSATSSGYSSGIPESIMDIWDPTEADRPGGADKATSSAYTPSYYYGVSSAPVAAGARPPPSGVSNQPQLAMAAKSSDMSWLNLGDQSRV